jgi:hypothetical protein
VSTGIGVAPYGSGCIQQSGGSLYGLLPPEVHRLWGVESGDELALGYAATEQTLLMTPEDLASEVGWASQFPDV